LFLMLQSQPANGRMTATEVAERHEEKLLMLGPVLERIHNELLSPLVDITFDRCMESGILPPPPEEIQGVDLDIEFISVLAQAQRAVAVNGMERLVSTAVSLAPVRPEILDKINFDQVIDDMGNAFGVNPAIVISDDDAAAARAQRAQQAAAMQAAATAPTMVQTAKTASDINTDQLRDVMGMLQGYSSPSPAMVQ
jgi:Bacteriophage head to tail connecting protein